MQQDAQELLRCILCGLDDAGTELQKVKQESIKQELEVLELKKSVPCTSGDLECQSPLMIHELEKICKFNKHRPTLKGGRGRGRKKRDHTGLLKANITSSKGTLHSFFNAKEAPALFTKIYQQQEPIEGRVSTDKNSDSDLTVSQSSVAVTRTDSGNFMCDRSEGQSSFESMNRRSSSPVSVSSQSHDGSESSDVIFCGESPGIQEDMCNTPNHNFVSKDNSETISSSSAVGVSSSHACTSTLKSPSVLPMSSSSKVHNSYLVSVKDTEGRRSRLGLRGKSKSFVFNNRKMSTLSENSVIADENCSYSYSPKRDPNISSNDKNIGTISSDNSQNSPSVSENSLRAKTPDYFPPGHPSSPTSKALHNSPINGTDLQADVDEIAELPLNYDESLKSRTYSGNIKKATDSPSQEPKLKEVEEDKDLLLSQSNGSSVVPLTPGKHIIIHSPFLTRPGFYTPQLQSRSGGLLARLGNLLPGSARRVLNFDSMFKDTHPVLSQSSQLPPQSSAAIVSSHKQGEGIVDSDDQTDISRKVIKSSADQFLHQARIQLKRCDWLGVSPVKSISASYVRKILRDSHQDNKSNCSKSKEPLDKGFLSNIDEKEDCLPVKMTRKRSQAHSSNTPSEFLSPTSKQSTEGQMNMLPRPKRLKGSAFRKGPKDKNNRDTKLISNIDISKLHTFSINLKKCDWLMDSGKTYVKLDTKDKVMKYKCTRKNQETYCPPTANVKKETTSSLLDCLPADSVQSG